MISLVSFSRDSLITSPLLLTILAAILLTISRISSPYHSRLKSEVPRLALTEACSLLVSSGCSSSFASSSSDNLLNRSGLLFGGIRPPFRRSLRPGNEMHTVADVKGGNLKSSILLNKESRSHMSHCSSSRNISTNKFTSLNPFIAFSVMLLSRRW